VLGFEAESAVLFVIHAADAGEFAIEKIAGVELHAGFGGEHFQAAAGGWFFHPGDRFEGGTVAFEDEVVIVAAGIVGELIEARANGGGFLEIEGRAGNGREFAGGNELVVDRCVAIGGDADDVLENVTGTGEVEVAVIG
jgi:hypothetical protein